MPILVVGLGPGDPDLLTTQARDALAAAHEPILRTARHPTVSLLDAWGKAYRSYDHWYEQESSFDRLYQAIVADLLEQGRQGTVVYAVPGHPLVGESTVQALLAQSEVPVRILPGLSGLEATYALLGVDPVKGLTILDALQLEGRAINPELGALVLQLYSKRVACQAKIALMRHFPDEHPVSVVIAAGVPGQERRVDVPLYEIDRLEVDHLTSLYLPPAPAVGVERLRQVIARLRGPGGCPWDREQTHETLRRYVLEEAYELVEAIDEQDEGKILEELGDVLLQVVLHAQIAEEAETFDLQEVAEGIADKLEYRHPHVFGTVSVENAEEVVANWEQLKRAEKGEPASALDGVPPMSALSMAEKLLGKASKVGFAWPDAAAAQEKLNEELVELGAAIATGDQGAIQQELGDVFFALCGLARPLKLEPEDALRQACRRFRARFRAMEDGLGGQDPRSLGLGEWRARWDAAKAQEA